MQGVEKPTNCRNEPSYPGIQTVVFVLSAPDMTAHLVSERCSIEYPHSIECCGEWQV